MEKEEFVRKVQSLAGLGSNEQAERVSAATLTVLRQWLTPDMARELAAAMPGELARALEGPRQRGQAGASLEDFFSRIAAEMGTTVAEIVRPVNAACEMIRESIDPKLEEKLLRELPEEFDNYFSAGPGAQASRSEVGAAPPEGQR